MSFRHHDRERATSGFTDFRRGVKKKWHRTQFASLLSSVRHPFQQAEERPINHAGGDLAGAGDGAEDGADGGCTGYAAIQPERSADNNYGYTDFRSISRWKYATRLLRGRETRAKMSIGTLHVRVAEARGLMARDFAGRSDPFVVLDLTGRYLSHGQEWSKHLQISDKTSIQKFSLNPVWNEDFSMPIRRVGAVLKIGVWDWNLSIAHDHLGSFEVPIGDELLSQKTLDKWYVLEAPLDLGTGKSAAGISDAYDNMQSCGMWDDGGDETNQQRDEMDAEPATVTADIEERRKAYGEVRLELRFEFDEFGEALSHIWPEEPPKPPIFAFSPNRLFYNSMFLWQLLLPWVEFFDEAGKVLAWLHPWASLFWLVSLVVLLSFPYMLIITINATVLWMVISRYRSHEVVAFPEEGPSSTTSGKNAVSDDIETGTAAPAFDLNNNPVSRKVRRHMEATAALLPPLEAPRDDEMDEMYANVCKTKKLPDLVESVGKKAAGKDAQDLQTNMQIWITILATVRRVFHPLNAKMLSATIFIIAAHTTLQLWLYRTSRIHVYFVLVVAGLFSANFCSWRGRAFILAIRAALESRKRRIALTSRAAETPDPFCAAAPASPPVPAAVPTPEERTEETPALTAGISQTFAGTCGGRDGGGQPLPVSGAASASSTRAAASVSPTTWASGSGTVVAARAARLGAPVSSTTPITHGALLVRELLQPTTEAVSSMVLPAGAHIAGATDHDDAENVSLMRGAAGSSLGGTAGGSYGGYSSYGSTIARSPEIERASTDDAGDEQPREESDLKPQHDEEQTESKAHRFLHGPSRLMHKISGRDDHNHAGHADNEDTPGAPESPGKSGKALRFWRGPSHLMHKVAREHHAHGGKESTTPDDPEAVGSTKGSPESSDSHSHKWHRPHWHHKKHDSK